MQNMTMDEIVKMMLNKSVEKDWINNKPVHEKGRVNILGLFWLEFCFRNIGSREDIPGIIWTMNDYYKALKWLKNIDRVFQLHPYDDLKKFTDKPSNQICLKRFNEDVKNIMVTDNRLKDFFLREVILLDYKEMHNKYYDLIFANTLDYMIMQAVDEGYKSIYLYGVFMQNDNHRRYIRSLLKTINKARELGVEIVFDWEDELKAYPDNNMETKRYLDVCYKGEINV